MPEAVEPVAPTSQSTTVASSSSSARSRHPPPPPPALIGAFDQGESQTQELGLVFSPVEELLGGGLLRQGLATISHHGEALVDAGPSWRVGGEDGDIGEEDMDLDEAEDGAEEIGKVAETESKPNVGGQDATKVSDASVFRQRRPQTHELS